ncbi:MAG: phosphate ABC transporter permease subunit PstC [Thermoclostridium sp.]|nr:phosphate ABC transporter permease subunit PstC [Thermoclostridium sp.]
MQSITRQKLDKISKAAMLTFVIALFTLLIALFIMLVQRSQLILGKSSLQELLFSSVWDPQKGAYGFFPAIVGTFVVTFLAMIIAIPLSLLCSIYISEYAAKGMKTTFQSFIDVLAGIPSVVYGLCALLVLVPFVRDTLAPLFQVKTTGMCVFTAALVLAIMVIPVMISISVESLRALPVGLREQFLSLGATKLQLVETVLLRAAGPGIISGIILGFGRAFGETMAVAMVIGNKNILSTSLFSPGQTLPSLLIGSFGEMMSVPEQQSALIFMALVLFLIIVLFNIVSNCILNRLRKRWRYE